MVIAFVVAGIARWVVKKIIDKTPLKEAEDKAGTKPLGKPDTSMKTKLSLGGFIANLVYFIVFMLFVPGIFSSLGIMGVSEPITSFLITILEYLPNIIGAAIVLAAALIFGVAFLLANFVERLLVKGGFKAYGKIVHVAIMIVAVFMMLNQLGIATMLVNAAFILALGAVAVAFAIAFGIGGRDFAKKQLGDLDVTLDKIKKDSKTAMEKADKEEQSNN